MGTPITNMFRSLRGSERRILTPDSMMIAHTTTKTPPITGSGIEAIRVANFPDRPNMIIQAPAP